MVQNDTGDQNYQESGLNNRAFEPSCPSETHDSPPTYEPKLAEYNINDPPAYSIAVKNYS